MIFRIRSKSQTRKPLTRPRCRPRHQAKPAILTLEDRTLLSFAAPLNLPTGQNAEGIVAADLIGNGIQDLVVANNGFSGGSGSSLSILLGNGDGTFQPNRNLDVGPNPFAIAVGHFDGSGIPDLAVTHASPTPNGPETVTILLGNGDATFRNAGDYQVGEGPDSIAVADFNGDGHDDLVTSNIIDNMVSVLLGNGDGTFQSAVNLPVGPVPESVAVGDFAGDGNIGIVTANEGHAQGGSISLLLGNGDGTFQAAVTLPLSQGGDPLTARSIAVADVNGDGTLDLITANDAGSAAAGSVSVLLGNGDGTFQAPVTFAAGGEPLSVAVGDFHGDGRPDLIVTNPDITSRNGDHLNLLRGNGDGTFQAPVSLDAGKLPRGLAVGDFNGDGTLDVAVANNAGADVTVLLGQGDGTFAQAPDPAAGQSPDTIVSADLSGSGIPDLVIANRGDDSVSVLLGNGDGIFQPAQNFPAGHQPLRVVVGDFNGDGIPDLLVLDAGAAPSFQGTLSLLRGNGDGTFQAPQTMTFHPGPSIFPVDLVVGDFNGDGIPDVAVSEVVLNGGTDSDEVDVLLGNGDGTFQNFVGTTLPVGANPQGMAVADFNGDGILDLAVAGTQGTRDGVYVLRGAGNGSFVGPFSFLPTGTTSRGVAVGDLNGDGVPDLVVTNFLSDTVSVLLGNGNGIFQPAVNYAVGGGPTSVVVGDFNGDGIPDLATANAADDTVSVLAGVGDGTFQAETRYLVGSGPTGLAAGDFNGDGALDLATANSTSNNVTLLLNRNDGAAPGQAAPQSSAERARAVHAGAVDAVFAESQRESPNSVAPSQPVAAAVDAVPAAGSREAFLAPQAPAVADARIPPHRHQEDRAVALDIPELAGLLVEPL
jgi:hypothetical protein